MVNNLLIKSSVTVLLIITPGILGCNSTGSELEGKWEGAEGTIEFEGNRCVLGGTQPGLELRGTFTTDRSVVPMRLTVKLDREQNGITMAPDVPGTRTYIYRIEDKRLFLGLSQAGTAPPVSLEEAYRLQVYNKAGT